MSTPYFQQWSSLRGRGFSGASLGQYWACPPVEDLGFSRGWHCPVPVQVPVLGPARVLWWGRGGSWQCAPVKAAGPYVWQQDCAGGGWEQRWRCCTTLGLVFWRGRRDGRRMDGVAPLVLWPWGSLQSVLCDLRALWGSGGCHWISSHLQHFLRTWRPTLCRIKLKPYWKGNILLRILLALGMSERSFFLLPPLPCCLVFPQGFPHYEAASVKRRHGNSIV